jgi:hypothetical protein
VVLDRASVPAAPGAPRLRAESRNPRSRAM